MEGKVLPGKRYLEAQLLKEEFTIQFEKKDIHMRDAVPEREVST